jgi:predicted O-methyltransferase YrrM
MAAHPRSVPDNLTREQRIEALLEQLRPKVEQAVRRMVERAVDVPEAEEFGAIDLAFRDAGQELATEVRQAALASRKKRGT